MAAHTLVLADVAANQQEMMAIAGFLAAYGANTRISYATDLRIFTPGATRAT